MDLGAAVERYTQPAWLTAAGTAAGYAAILLVMTALLFGLPYLIFVSL